MMQYCQTCRFWEKIDDVGIPVIGLCRRHAPQPVLRPEGKEYQAVPEPEALSPIWPVVRCDECCGDGEQFTSSDTAAITR